MRDILNHVLGFSNAGSTICVVDLVWIGAVCSKKMAQALVKVALWWQKKKKKKQKDVYHIFDLGHEVGLDWK